MTIIRLDGADERGDGDAEAILDLSVEEITELLSELARLKERLKTRGDEGLDGGDTKEAGASLVAVRTLIRIALAERKAINELRKRDAGIAYDYALDLGAARDEITRRLDRLRASGGAGGVPG